MATLLMLRKSKVERRADKEICRTACNTSHRTATICQLTATICQLKESEETEPCKTAIWVTMKLGFVAAIWAGVCLSLSGGIKTTRSFLLLLCLNTLEKNIDLVVRIGNVKLW